MQIAEADFAFNVGKRNNKFQFSSSQHTIVGGF